MKKILLLGILGFGMVLGGCATPQYNYQVASQNVSKPPIDSVNEAFVGDKLIMQGVFTEREAIYVSENKTAFGGVFVNKGYYLKIGEDRKGIYYQALNNFPDGGLVNPPNIGLILDTNGNVCILTALMTKSCQLKIDAKKTLISVATDNSFQQTLIYSGKVGDKINVGYREFSSNMARPAFNNDVEYDLNESKTIGYKGALLEVIDANNQSIKYKVLRNFNKAD